MMAAIGCGNGTSGPPDGGPPLALDVLDPPGTQIGVHYGKSIDLRVRYHADDATAQPIAGQSVRFSIFGDPAGSTLARDHSTTDSSGIATVTLTGGQAEASFRVAANAVNAPEADFDISVSKLDFVELDVQLSWGLPTSPAALRALLYDDRGCAQLPPSSTMPAPFRALSQPNSSAATLRFLNLLSKSYAVVGRAETASGKLLGYGCVDLGAELVPPGSVSTLPLPLSPVSPSPAGSYTLTSNLVPMPSLATTLVARWGTYGHCIYGAAQTLLDAMSISSHRDPVGGDGCRPISTTSLDFQLQQMLTAPPSAPALQLDHIVDDLAAITSSCVLTSHLTVTPAGAGVWSGEHTLSSISFSAGPTPKSYDLVALGMPVIDVKDIALSDDGIKLGVANHGFTLGWTTLWKQAFIDLSLTVKIAGLGTPPIHALVAAVVAAAMRSGKMGCAAVEDLLCAVIGGPCNYQAACVSAIDSVAASLDGPFAPTSGIDLSMAGSAQAVDNVGDLVVHQLIGGSWSSSVLQPSTFSGTKP
jgi:hypothetical protein